MWTFRQAKIIAVRIHCVRLHEYCNSISCEACINWCLHKTDWIYHVLDENCDKMLSEKYKKKKNRLRKHFQNWESELWIFRMEFHTIISFCPKKEHIKYVVVILTRLALFTIAASYETINRHSKICLRMFKKSYLIYLQLVWLVENRRIHAVFVYCVQVNRVINTTFNATNKHKCSKQCWE